MLNQNLTGVSPVLRLVKPSLAVLVLASLAVSARAQIVSLSDLNSSTTLNFGSGSQTAWSVEGQSQLNMAGYYYRVGNTAESSLGSIGAAVIATSNGTRGVTATYANGQFTVQLDYLLTGGTAGSGNSSLSETVRIINNSANPLDFHFFQYSDFDLAGTASGDSVSLSSIGGNYFFAQQMQAGFALSQTVFTPGANHGEADLVSATLTRLNDGLPTTLNDSTSAGPGDVSWALQWDLTIAAGGSISITKGTTIQLQAVPEPSILALAGLGVAGWILRRKRA
ncbi:MAG TPA: PEP-CTERM sorting domain-containing protein [Verrucomicrobiae bacterium]|nr:PEP-CTERM sorting domain-containing protein [Verrucomicrobiae bacterium]